MGNQIQEIGRLCAAKYGLDAGLFCVIFGIPELYQYLRVFLRNSRRSVEFVKVGGIRDISGIRKIWWIS